MTLEDKPPKLVGAQYATREEQRNSSRKHEEAAPKWKWYPVMDAANGCVLDAISKMTEWSSFISKANHSISQ